MSGFNRRRAIALASLIVLSPIAHANAQDAADAAYHRGVELGRSGDYARAFALLLPLLKQEPDNYPLRRDIVVIYSWQGDCRSALRFYRPIRHRPNPEDYLVSAVGGCLLQEHRPRAARALLVPARKRYPQNADIETLLQQAQQTLVRQQRPTLRMSLESDSSDKGNIEWEARASAEQVLTDRWILTGRWLAVRAQDPKFATGDLNRMGLGLRYALTGQTNLAAEYSEDVIRTGEEGWSESLSSALSRRWHLNLGYDGFSEDVPLRAKALNVRATSGHGSVDFHTVDWRWEGSASGARMNFSDGNLRTSLAANVDYATVLEPKHERRLVLELAHSTNTLPAAGVVYYNPASDYRLLAGYRIIWLPTTRYHRLERHITLAAGYYAESGYATEPVATVHLEQELQFTTRSELDFHMEFSSNVYDGGRETDVTGGIEYRRNL